jgi:hypothetical protein
MSINNYLLFKFIKLYLHDDIKFNGFNFTNYSCNYGKYGSYGGFKWSAKKDITNIKISLLDADYILTQPIDPLDTIFMFHDYKLGVSQSKWNSFKFNIDALFSVLYLSRNYRIINFLTGILSMPFICGFSLFCKVHLENPQNKEVIILEEKFRDKLKSYYESDESEISYKKLYIETEQIYDDFIRIFQKNNTNKITLIK